MMIGVTTMMVLGGCGSTTNSSSEGTIRAGVGDGYELLSKSIKDEGNEYILQRKEGDSMCKYVLTKENDGTDAYIEDILQRKEGDSINKYHLLIGSGAYVMPLVGLDNEVVCDKIKNKDISKGKKIIVHIQ